MEYKILMNYKLLLWIIAVLYGKVGAPNVLHSIFLYLNENSWSYQPIFLEEEGERQREEIFNCIENCRSVTVDNTLCAPLRFEKKKTEKQTPPRTYTRTYTREYAYTYPGRHL